MATISPCTPKDPCECAPGLDKEIIFNEATCLATDPRFLWDYSAGLLSVDGAIAASGYIGSSSQVEGAYIAPQALGTGSFNFTPPAGYGGFIYRGGSIFYYWNNTANAWESVDFAGGELVGSQINVSHNGTLLGAFTDLNFVDSSAGVWSLDGLGNIQISLSATWTSNVNANFFGITNLNSINGIPIGNFLTNPITQNVNFNGFNITNAGNITASSATFQNLTVPGEIIYQGQPLSVALGQELWTLEADGSIFRNSNVSITGSYNTTSKTGPFTVQSLNNSNYLYLDTTGSGADEFAAFAVLFDGVYGGELGFSTNGVELWTGNRLLIQGFPDGHLLIPGNVGILVNPPLFTLDVSGIINSHQCFYIGGQPFACSAGASGINLTNVLNINGVAVGAIAQTPWLSAINGNGYPLNNAGPIQTNGITVGGSINISGQYLINGVPINTGGGAQQTPWTQNINGAGFNLGNVSAIGIGGGAGAIPLYVTGSAGGDMISVLNTNQAAPSNIAFTNNASGNSISMGVMGTSESPFPGLSFINFTGNNTSFVIGANNAAIMTLKYGPAIGIGTTNPQYNLDVSGNVNASTCYYVNGVAFACVSGSGSVNLSNVNLINGAPPGGGGGTAFNPQPHIVTGIQVPINYYGPFAQFRFATVYFNNVGPADTAYGILQIPGVGSVATVAAFGAGTSATIGTLYIPVPVGCKYSVDTDMAVTQWIEYY